MPPVAQAIDPALDCPPCVRCRLPTGTPLVDCAGNAASDRWYSDDLSPTVRCPACGFAWRATPAELGQALRALHAYEAREGREPAACSCPRDVDPRQLALPGLEAQP